MNLANWLAAKRNTPNTETVICSPFGRDAFGLKLDLGAAYLNGALSADFIL
jgi:hypothetical protein